MTIRLFPPLASPLPAGFGLRREAGTLLELPQQIILDADPVHIVHSTQPNRRSFALSLDSNVGPYASRPGRSTCAAPAGPLGHGTAGGDACGLSGASTHFTGRLSVRLLATVGSPSTSRVFRSRISAGLCGTPSLTNQARTYAFTIYPPRPNFFASGGEPRLVGRVDTSVAATRKARRFFWSGLQSSLISAR